MPEFLRFTLLAPLAAIGDVAIGERRYGTHRPAKSAVIGLLGAALGIDRLDEAGHQRLDAGLAMAAMPFMPGRLMTDYHTVQMPRARTGRRKGEGWSTRRDELAEKKLETVLSWRDYLQDAAFTLLLWAKPAQVVDLEPLAAALKRPVFILYFGRKACPLGRPPEPELLAAPSLSEGFKAVTGPIYADIEGAMLTGDGWQVQRRHRRRDRIHRRRGWMFGLRDEVVIGPVTAEATA